MTKKDRVITDTCLNVYRNLH